MFNNNTTYFGFKTLSPRPMSLRSLIGMVILVHMALADKKSGLAALTPGQCITNPDSGKTYTILKRLSSGAEGITYTARDSRGETICLKSSKKSCMEKARFEAEWIGVMHTNFPNSFPKIYECFKAKGKDTNGEPVENAFVAMHFFDGYKQLKDFVSEYGGPLPADVAKELLQQIVEICVNIHSLPTDTGKKYYHGDFNFKNIMISNNGDHVVVIDPKNNSRNLFMGRNAREAKDMCQVAAHALYLAVGDNKMSLADIKQKHIGVFDFISTCMGDMLEEYNPECNGCRGTGNTKKDSTKPKPCTDGDKCESCDGTGEEGIGEGRFITQSILWWGKHQKKNVIASATTMRDFMNTNVVYVDAVETAGENPQEEKQLSDRRRRLVEAAYYSFIGFNMLLMCGLLVGISFAYHIGTHEANYEPIRW